MAVEEEVQPSRAWVRWPVLLLTCGGLFGQFYAFDNPSALNEQMRQYMSEKAHTTPEQYAYFFNLLYSVYSFPNILLPLVMGLAVDRCGCTVLLCFLGACVVLGHVVFAAGLGQASWPVMLCGRVLFGIGGESLQVAQNCLLFRWFRGKEVAFALGLNLSIARSGSVLNDVLSPWTASKFGVVSATWLGVGMCLGSFVCNAGCAYLDRIEGRRAGLADATEDEVSVKEILRMPKLFWLLSAHCVILYCAILPFNNIASAYFVEVWFPTLPLAQAQQQAGNAMSLLFLASAFGTPPFGGLVDYIGLRGQFLLGSSFALTFVFGVINILPPAVSMLGLGGVYMVFSGALWPAFALTVPQNQLGTAYGVVVSLQNCGLAVVPIGVAHIQAQSAKGDFTGVMHLFTLFGILGVIVSVMILNTDYATGKPVLQLPSRDAELRSRECEAEKKPLKDSI
jgi:MFS family permease